MSASYLQCNKLNRGHPTLISQSQVTFTTKESGFSSLQTNQKQEHFIKFQSVGFIGGPDWVRCTVTFFLKVSRHDLILLCQTSGLVSQLKGFISVNKLNGWVHNRIMLIFSYSILEKKKKSSVLWENWRPHAKIQMLLSKTQIRWLCTQPFNWEVHILSLAIISK